MEASHSVLADLPRSHADIEFAAWEARHRLGFGPEEPLPGVQMFENVASLASAESGIPVDYHVMGLPLGVEAETRFEPAKKEILVVLASETYDDLEADVPRARFSVAHEFGHVVMHLEELIRLSKIPRKCDASGLLRSRRSEVPVYMDVEWQANSFASALLAPASCLMDLDSAGKLSVEEICRMFIISKTCARIRLDVFQRHGRSLLRRIP